MRRTRLSLLLLVLLASSVLADQMLQMSLKEYKKKRAESQSRQAYDRAAQRIRGVKLGMRTDQFFDKMEMLMVRDKNGKPMDGFVEGYLHKESNKLNKKKKGKDKYLVFGYYKNVWSQKGAVQKFFVVFKHKRLQEVGFFDPKDDFLGASGSGR